MPAARKRTSASPVSTGDYDRGDKLSRYKQIASLQAVLIVSHRRPGGCLGHVRQPCMPCRDVGLTTHRMESAEQDAVRPAPSDMAWATFDVDTGELAASGPPPGVENQASLVEELRSLWQPAQVE